MFLSLPDVKIHYEDQQQTTNLSCPGTILAFCPWSTTISLMKPKFKSFTDYRVVYFEGRAHGETIAPLSDSLDYFVQAVDAAFLMESLEIQQYHVFGPTGLFSHTSICLAFLFPKNILSLVLVGCVTVTKLPEAVGPCQEVINAWMLGEEDEYMEAIGGLMAFYNHQDVNLEKFVPLIDSIIDLFLNNFNPLYSSRVYELTRLSGFLSGMTESHLSSIETPILILHGLEDVWVNRKECLELKNQLSGSKGLQVQFLRGPHLLAVTHFEECSTLMRPFFKLYDTPRPKFEKLDRLNALKLLSTISNDPNLLKRDLNSSNSFSAISMEFRKEVKLKIEKIAELDKNSIFNLDHIIGVRSNSLIGDEICESEKWKWSTRKSFCISDYCHSFIVDGDIIRLARDFEKMETIDEM